MGSMLMEGQKSKNAKAVLIRLWGYLKRHTGTLIFTTLLVMAIGGIDMLGPYIMGIAIDR